MEAKIKSVFVNALNKTVETVETQITLAYKNDIGQLSLTLIGFLETENYVLEFSNNKSTTVEFEGITYEILPYEFKFPFKNPRSSKQQMEAAQSQGAIVGGMTSVVPQDSPAA